MAVITCPVCSARYQVDDAYLAEVKPSRFRCRKCKAISTVQQHIVGDTPQKPSNTAEDSPVKDSSKPPMSQEEQPRSDSSPDSGSSLSASQSILEEHGASLDTALPSLSQSSPDDISLDDLERAEKMLEQLEAHEDIDVIVEQEGELRDISGNTPIILNNNQHIWRVHSGLVDIFTVRMEHGEIVGARTHLLRLEPGQIFFGCDTESDEKNRGFLAVGSVGTSVFRVEIARVKKLAQEQEFTAIGLGTLIDRWVTQVLDALRRALIPKDCELVPVGQECEYTEGVNITSEKGVLWLGHQKGSSRLFGRDSFPPIEGEEFFPLLRHSWLQTTCDVRVIGSPVDECIGQELFWDSLNTFHAMILECIIASIQEFEVNEQKRLEEKQQQDIVSLSNAFSQLSSVVGTSKKHEFVEETSSGLLTVCNVVGKYSGISFKAHPNFRQGVRTNDPLEDIARASRVRTRKVILKDRWWKNDNGAFLAYNTEEKYPVALIPTSATSYKLVDPLNKLSYRVNAAVAESLEPIAFMFYRPFPDYPLNLWGLLKFGAKGSGMDVTIILTVATLGALLGLLPPIFTGKIFNSVIPESNISQLTQLTLILLVTAVTMTMFEITKAIGLLRFEGKLDTSIQAALWDRLLALPVPFFRNYTAGDLANRSLGINAIRQIFSGTVVQSLFTGIFSFFYWCLLFYYNWQLALVATGLGITAILCTSCIGYYFVLYQKPIQTLEGKISGLLFQLLTGINKLRITGTEDRAFALWSKEFSAKKKISIKSKTTQNILITFNAIFPAIASMTIFAWVVYRTKDSISVGDFLAFNSAYLCFQAAVIQMSIAFVSALTAFPIYERLQPILEAPLEIDEAKSSPPQLSGDIEINQINFRYQPTGPLILHNMSLKISPGEFVAFVGSSGSGKSTLMRLLLGFEQPESGTIYFDGQDLDSVDLREVRQQLGVVLQNSRIMQGTILENIIGSSTLTIKDGWEAAGMAGCDEDIRAMPMQMHTVLPPGGGTLSGGQRQRVLIARAIVKKPRVLIFDEATSALDNKTQEIVSQSIEQLQATRIVIAHRLSTIMHADRIYVLEKGRLVQEGSYEELIGKKGMFAELAKRQLA